MFRIERNLQMRKEKINNFEKVKFAPYEKKFFVRRKTIILISCYLGFEIHSRKYENNEKI